MANPKDLQPLVKEFSSRLRDRKVCAAVVGDMILDNAIEGVPGGRHPEIGVPILKEATTQESIGGAANIALILNRLGVDVSLFGVIGSDPAGHQLQILLDRLPFPDYLITQRGWPTPHKDWIYQRHEGRLSLLHRVDYDKPLPATARDELVGEFRARISPQMDVVILVDHALGSIGPESLPIIGLAKEHNAKLVGIPRTTVLRGHPLDAIVINSPEMRNFYGAESNADHRALAARYAREFNQHVFLTMLDEGVLVCPAGTKTAGTPIPVFPIENPLWMGARDMATAIVALCLALGFDPIDTGKLANAFRHLIACQRGNGRVLWRDVFQWVGLNDG